MTDFEVMIDNIMKPTEDLLPEINVMFFWADWCSHCGNADMDRIHFQEKYNGQIIDGYKIKCTVYNETTDQEQMTKYGITCFPTIIALKDSTQVELNGKINESSLEEFLQHLTTSA